MIVNTKKDVGKRSFFFREIFCSLTFVTLRLKYRMNLHVKGRCLSMLASVFVLRTLFCLTLLGGGLMTMIFRNDFLLSSSAFKEGESIPSIYTCDNEDKNGISPPLEWSNAPRKTKSFVLIMDDPDVPHEPGAPPRVWDHWVLFNIPATTTKLEKNLKHLPKGAKSGNNSWNRSGYGGPCPPDREHRYFFKVYALDAELTLKEGSSKQDIENAMQGRILGEAQLMARYDRPNRA